MKPGTVGTQNANTRYVRTAATAMPPAWPSAASAAIIPPSTPPMPPGSGSRLPSIPTKNPTVTSAIGGVAPVPLRLNAVEDLLVGSTLDDETVTSAAAVAAQGANPLPETGYKVTLIEATVLEVLERVR